MRVADAKPMHLGHVIEADARWRIFAFADQGHARLEAFVDYLDRDPSSPVNRFTPTGKDRDSVFDIRAVLQENHRELNIEDMPELLRPEVGKFGLRDYEKVFTVDHKSGDDIFEMRGVDRKQGCVVVVRPDQYVAQVLPLDAHDELSDYFAAFMLEQA